MYIKSGVYCVPCTLCAYLPARYWLVSHRYAPCADKHTEAGLPYTATDGKRQCIIHQAFVEVKFQAFLFAFLFELAKQGFLVYADTHGGKFDAALQDVVP